MNDFLEKIREKWNKLSLSYNCIDKIMTDKVDDYILIEEFPIPINIGDKVIYVGNFTYDNEEKFFKMYSKILGALSARIINMELMDDRRKELLEKSNFHLISNGAYMYEFLTMDRWLKKQIMKLLKKTLIKQQAYILTDEKRRILKEWRNCSYKYFKKHITKEKIIEILFLIYLYNFDSQKKSLKVIMGKMNQKSLEETYIPFWLQNLAGLTGRFQVVPQLNTDSSSRDFQKAASLKDPREVKSESKD